MQWYGDKTHDDRKSSFTKKKKKKKLVERSQQQEFKHQLSPIVCMRGEKKDKHNKHSIYTVTFCHHNNYGVYLWNFFV